MSLYKTKEGQIQERPNRINKTFIGAKTDLSQYGYYEVTPEKPSDAPDGQRYVDSGSGTYDEENMTYTADWVLEDIPPEPQPDLGSIITRFAFRQRFTFAERVAIKDASNTDTGIAVWLEDLQTASYIDLEREEATQGVNVLAQKGIIGSARASEILDAPVKEHEIPS